MFDCQAIARLLTVIGATVLDSGPATDSGNGGQPVNTYTACEIFPAGMVSTTGCSTRQVAFSNLTG